MQKLISIDISMEHSPLRCPIAIGPNPAPSSFASSQPLSSLSYPEKAQFTTDVLNVNIQLVVWTQSQLSALPSSTGLLQLLLVLGELHRKSDPMDLCMLSCGAVIMTVGPLLFLNQSVVDLGHSKYGHENKVI
ncbi:unnamed protein product [Allacma fusca]|uniref:Uncharacterized protein n=1 Tax=Allacma fusca TaxID=39272 RepID=A0A8J2NV36_9HEXA|nr:unnamed protein product [Allacma fusca]